MKDVFRERPDILNLYPVVIGREVKKYVDDSGNVYSINQVAGLDRPFRVRTDRRPPIINSDNNRRVQYEPDDLISDEIKPLTTDGMKKYLELYRSDPDQRRARRDLQQQGPFDTARSVRGNDERSS